MQLISTIGPHFDYSSFLSSNLTKFDSVFGTNFNWSPHISSLAFLVYTRRGVSLHWNGRHVFLTEYWRYINAFLQNLGWFVQMKYRFSERKQSQPRTYLFHTLDVHVKLYGNILGILTLNSFVAVTTTMVMISFFLVYVLPC